MSMENIRDLFLEDETFEDARQKFNTVLQRLFRSMIDTESNEGSITLKMDVSMQTEYIPNHDPDIKGESRCVRLPQFAYKVSSSITVKDEQKGNKNPQMELVWDDKQQKYVLQYVANTEQRSIFDKDFQEEMNSGSNQEGIETSPERDYLDVKQIAGPVADEGALPGDVTDPDSDAIDGDYREVDTGEAGAISPGMQIRTEKHRTETRKRSLMAIMKLITPDMTTRIRKHRRNKQRGGMQYGEWKFRTVFWMRCKSDLGKNSGRKEYAV